MIISLISIFALLKLLLLLLPLLQRADQWRVADAGRLLADVRGVDNYSRPLRFAVYFEVLLPDLLQLSLLPFAAAELQLRPWLFFAPSVGFPAFMSDTG